MSKIFRKAALGGTFDRLHIGHETLLSTALQLADRVIVGVTHDSLNQHKAYASLIQDYSTRHQTVALWLEANKLPHQSIEVIQIKDLYGPTLTDPDIDVLVVTSQTRPGGDLINHQRTELNLHPLPIVEVPLIMDEAGTYVSSTRIRSGHITRTGMVFRSLFSKDYNFSTGQLQNLNKLQGKLISLGDLNSLTLQSYTAIALIGDIVTQTFLDRSLPFTYAVIDGKTKRQNYTAIAGDFIYLNTTNLPGTINAGTVTALLDSINLSARRKIYRVNGEEDLLAFVPVLTLPLNSLVFYGQPNQGIGMIKTDEAAKLHYARFIQPDPA